MSNKIPHLAFIQKYSSRAREIVITLTVKNRVNGKEEKIYAVWDTGATGTVITKELFNKLNITIIDTVIVNGVNSSSEALVGIVDIMFENFITITNVRVIGCDSIGSEKSKMLIGMDIITMGDMSISNHNGETHFSFAIPPFENRANLLDKANAINKNNKNL